MTVRTLTDVRYEIEGLEHWLQCRPLPDGKVSLASVSTKGPVVQVGVFAPEDLRELLDVVEGVVA